MAEEEEAIPEPTYKDVAYGPYERNRLDFWSAGVEEPAALVVNIHGGGFKMGEKAAGPQLLKWASEKGVAVAAIAYRFSQDAIAPASFTDAARAIQFLRHKADEWGVDKTRVATIGPSAGAGLGMWMAFRENMADPASDDPVLRESTRLACVIGNSGQSSYDPRFIRELFPDFPVYKEPALAQLFDVDLDRLDDLPGEKYRLFEEVSPINYVSSDAPPVMLNYGMAVDAPITDQGVGIHHARFGVPLKEELDAVGRVCEFNADGKLVEDGSEARPFWEFLEEYLL